jgi:hypothetical protein
MTQLARGELLSPEYLTQNALIVFLFGLHNAARSIDHLVMRHMRPSPMDDKLMGMADYVLESFHDLIAGDSETISDSNSSRGSHHPSRECFMADTLEGHLESVHEQEVTPLADLDEECDKRNLRMCASS